MVRATLGLLSPFCLVIVPSSEASLHPSRGPGLFDPFIPVFSGTFYMQQGAGDAIVNGNDMWALRELAFQSVR